MIITLDILTGFTLLQPALIVTAMIIRTKYRRYSYDNTGQSVCPVSLSSLKIASTLNLEELETHFA